MVLSVLDASKIDMTAAALISPIEIKLIRAENHGKNRANLSAVSMCNLV